jgi:hypothetical protein
MGDFRGTALHARSIDFASLEVIKPSGERPMIRVRFSGVSGKFRTEGRPHGFAVHPAEPKDDQCHAVCRVDLDPSNPSALIVGVNCVLQPVLRRRHGSIRQHSGQQRYPNPGLWPNPDCDIDVPGRLLILGFHGVNESLRVRTEFCEMQKLPCNVLRRIGPAYLNC